MLRTVFTPRWLGLLALVVAVMISFGFLGLWQLDVARDRAHQEQAAKVEALPVADVATILDPHAVMSADSVGRKVTVTGTYDASTQVLVAGRRLGERQGYWVLTPLVVEASGARLPVLRGFVTDPAAASAPPGGRLTVRGVLSPPESAPNDVVTLPPGQIPSVDLAALVNVWPGDLYNAMVFASGEQRADGSAAGASAGLSRIPPPDAGSRGVQWRNLAYALQWWLFAGFALYMWWRMVREDHETRRLVAESEPSTDEPAGSAGPAASADRTAGGRTRSDSDTPGPPRAVATSDRGELHR